MILANYLEHRQEVALVRMMDNAVAAPQTVWQAKLQRNVEKEL